MHQSIFTNFYYIYKVWIQNAPRVILKMLESDRMTNTKVLKCINQFLQIFILYIYIYI